MRVSRLLIACGVVLLGLCAAWPYRQSPQPPPIKKPSSQIPLSLTIRRPDVPLELAPRIEVSPAEGLYSPTSLRDDSPQAPAALSATQTYALESLTPPPALPVAFHPATPPQQVNDWKPEVATRPAVRPRPPKPYRIRDGDTLEKIAERLLGNRERANEIFEANRDVLARPDLLPVGATIQLPPREIVGEAVSEPGMTAVGR